MTGEKLDENDETKKDQWIDYEEHNDQWNDINGTILTNEQWDARWSRKRLP